MTMEASVYASGMQSAISSASPTTSTASTTPTAKTIDISTSTT